MNEWKHTSECWQTLLTVIKTQGQAHSLLYLQSGVGFHRSFSWRVEWFMCLFVSFIVHSFISTSTASEYGDGWWNLITVRIDWRGWHTQTLPFLLYFLAYWSVRSFDLWTRAAVFCENWDVGRRHGPSLPHDLYRWSQPRCSAKAVWKLSTSNETQLQFPSFSSYNLRFFLPILFWFFFLVFPVAEFSCVGRTPQGPTGRQALSFCFNINSSNTICRSEPCGRNRKKTNVLDGRKFIPLKTSMEPENTHLEKEKHLQTINFWVPC